MRPRTLAVVTIVALALGAGALLLRRDEASEVARTDQRLTRPGNVRLETSIYVPDGVDRRHPAPAVLLAHGIGEDQRDTRRLARHLAGAGYVVRTWSSRGAGRSGGRVGIASPTDIGDVARLVDELGTRPDVLQDAAGDPRVGIAGRSLGGGIALLAAARDHRIDAVAPIFAWSSLADALEPNGVLKVRWASTLFAAGSGTRRTPSPCGRIEPELCAAWGASAAAGTLTPGTRALLAARSPAVGARVTAPTLIVQGQFDSLFDFTQATALAASLERSGTPHRIEWMRAGHDLDFSLEGQRHLDEAVQRWFDRWLHRRRSVETGPPLTIQLGAGRGYAGSGVVPVRTRAHEVPLEPADRTDRFGAVALAAPALGLPADTTTLPGLGDVTQLSELTSVPTGQRARFRGPVEPRGLELVGAPRVRLRVTSSRPDALLFVHLVDIAPSGQRLVPRALVTPLRLRGLPALGSHPGQPVDVELPPIAWRLAPAHRLGLEVASTDAGYVAEPSPATISVAIDDSAEPLTVPVAQGLRRVAGDAGDRATWMRRLASAGVIALAALLVGLVLARRATLRARRIDAPEFADRPVVVDGLVKRHRGGVLAVDGVDFVVEPGSIVGLVGPNGAGKTTVLRMLLGLVRPTRGSAWLFGQHVRPGAPMLRRVGALVEGPGLAPHHSGRQHLERYWSATGRPRRDAHIEEALDAVELSGDAHRRVSTWSHGMKQRLAIAQALLGRPDLVVLDEPTNGLDPAQIRHLRELVRGLARDGRSVLLSSHLLSELEQVSTHVVLLAGGRVLAAGTLADVIGPHADLETAFLHAIDGDAERPEAPDA